MKLYLGGAEIPSHKKTLEVNGVRHVYLSYTGLRRRVKFARPWLIKDKFPVSMHVLLESGAFTFNRGVGDETSSDELLEISAGYQDFVFRNIDRLDAFTEFDVLSLGYEWLEVQREDFYDSFDDRFMPVWHAEYGVEELERLAGRYRRIAILQTALGDRDLIPVLNLLAARRGTLFHGLAMTKPEIMRDVRWDSVGSTSWISPMQFGDTHVWTGGQLKRYPKAYKEKARKEHRALFERHGFDPDKILADDTAEVARLTLWSWQQLMDDLNRHAAPGAPESPELLSPFPSPEPRSDSAQQTTTGPAERQRILLPGIRLKTTEDGEQIDIRRDSLRRCDTCFLRDRGCPGYKPGAACLYEIPIEVKTPAQVRAVENALIAMQTQRVMFMRMVEDLEGGHANPNLSTEMDRLTRMIKAQREGSADKFSLTVNATRRPSDAGIIGTMFGKEVAQAQAIEAPSAADTLIKESMMAPVYNITEKE